MLVSDIPYSNIPFVTIENTIGEIKAEMQKYSLLHLPVISDEKVYGIVSLDMLKDLQPNTPIHEIHNQLIEVQVFAHHHLFSVLKIASLHNLSLVPVVNDNNEYLGSILQSNLINILAIYLDAEKSGGIIVLEMVKQDYSFGELCRLVETNDAYITQLNSFIEPLSGLLLVTIKVNKTEISDILATLQRYDYNIKYYFGEENYENELKENYENLMIYLNV